MICWNNRYGSQHRLDNIRRTSEVSNNNAQKSASSKHHMFSTPLQTNLAPMAAATSPSLLAPMAGRRYSVHGRLDQSRVSAVGVGLAILMVNGHAVQAIQHCQINLPQPQGRFEANDGWHESDESYNLCPYQGLKSLCSGMITSLGRSSGFEGWSIGLEEAHENSSHGTITSYSALRIESEEPHFGKITGFSRLRAELADPFDEMKIFHIRMRQLFFRQSFCI